MSRKKPEEMSDEMWAAVLIIMEDQQISSYKELTESHKAVIERMDQMENKWVEAQTQGQSDTGTQGDGENGTIGEGKGTGGGPVSDGEGTPPPIVESGSGEDDRPKGSGRGGKLRWYEREGYAK